MAVGSTIGTKLNHGYPGGYAIQPDALIASRVNVGDEDIKFGDLVIYKIGANGIEGVTTLRDEGGFDMSKFAGIATRTVKQGTDYLNNGEAMYHKNDTVGVFQRGIISVFASGAVKDGGKVYYRVKTNDAEAKPIGFCAEADSGVTATVELTGLQFAGSVDGNGIVAVCIKEKINV